MKTTEKDNFLIVWCNTFVTDFL